MSRISANEPVRWSAVAARVTLAALCLSLGWGLVTTLEAQRIDLSGSWSGPFQDEFHWRISPDSSLHAVCNGTLRIRLHQTDRVLAGELAQDQRCRIGDGDWFEELNDGWLIAGGAVDGSDVTFSTIQDGGVGLGTAFCRWRATLVLGAMRGRFDCTFSGHDGARAGGRYEITRQPGPKGSPLDTTR